MTEIDPGLDSKSERTKKWCEVLLFDDVNEGKGFNLIGIGRGPMIMSNVFLSTSLLRLASQAAGCVIHDDDDTIETPECTNKIYGFRPSSLVTNIATICGLLSALFMPLVGVLVDYTQYRRQIGIFTAVGLVIFQAIQIGTVQATWFVMVILQAFGFLLFQSHKLATFAYLPDLAGKVDEKKMAKFTSTFLATLYTSSLTFLLLISITSMLLGMSDVTTAQMSQAVSVVWNGVPFALGWNYLPNVPALQKKPEGKSYFVAGFTRIIATIKGINKHYGGSVRWFFLAIIFADAGFSAFTTVSVTYMSEVLKMKGSNIGICIAILLTASLPGSVLAVMVTSKTNPLTSFKICITQFSIVTIAASFVLTSPKFNNFTYLWSALWGMGIGWFYPTQNLIFSLCIPKGQEAELAGFYVYCAQIIVWLPPLLFTTINESGVHMKYALMSLVIFFCVALICLQCMDPWESVIKKAESNKLKQGPNETVNEADL